MKRLIFGMLVVSLLVFSGGLPTMSRAHAQTVPQFGASPPSSLNLLQMKELVRQTLGQQAVDHMQHRSSWPLSSHAFTSTPLPLKQTRTTAAPRAQANGQELYVNDPNMAGYSIDAEGASWVGGATASFNATISNGVPSFYDETKVMLTNSTNSQWIIAGVTSSNGTLDAFVYWLNWDDWNHPHGSYYDKIFPVRPGDQINVAIERYFSPNNPWQIFIEDVPLATYQWFNDSDNTAYTFTQASWTLDTYGRPIAPRYPSLIGFSHAQWYSNWDGWQPISSSATHTYSEITNVSPASGIISPSLADTGTSFALIPCPSCSG